MGDACYGGAGPEYEATVKETRKRFRARTFVCFEFSGRRAPEREDFNISVGQHRFAHGLTPIYIFKERRRQPKPKSTARESMIIDPRLVNCPGLLEKLRLVFRTRFLFCNNASLALQLKTWRLAIRL